MTRYIASIEARMGSSRLPGKMMADMCGMPVIARVVERLKACKRLDGIVLATTDQPKDLELVNWAEENGVPVFCGSEDDVLARVVGAQKMMQADAVIEICGDMVLLEPTVIDGAISRYEETNADVVTTTRQQSYPDGMDAQVFSLALLEEVSQTIFDADVREHVSLYFYQHPEKYKIVDLTAPENCHAPDIRLVLDYPQDLSLMRSIYEELRDGFGIEEILQLLAYKPELARLARSNGEGGR